MYSFFFFSYFFVLIIFLFLFFFLASLLSTLYLKMEFSEKLYIYFKWGIFLFSICFIYEYFFNTNVSLFNECEYWLSQSPMILLNISSLLFFLLAFVVSWSIMKFSISYMKDESGTFSFLAYLIFFLLFMFLLVFSGNFLFLFVSWESVGLLSFLLISWWYSRGEAITGSMQAIIYNRISDSSLLLFLVFYLVLSNNLKLGETMILSVLFLLFLMSVLAKSSQFLFHPWLPNAMESPTPVSSLLHSSTMVVASVYLLMRCSEMFDFKIIIFLFSLITCLLSGFFGFLQHDFKKIVAYSTTSQLGFMMMMLGLSFVSYCGLYMMAHAFFKAMIFMMSSYIIHMSSSNQDFRSLNLVSMINKNMLFMYIIGALVMMGFPFLSSFWIKDLVLEETNYSHLSIFIWFFYMISVLMTSLYSLRLYMCFFKHNSYLQKKMLISIDLQVIFSYFRLFLGSILVGLMLIMFYGPMKHFNINFMIKYFSLFILVLSTLFIVFFKKINEVKYFFINYQIYYNPIIHKFFMVIFAKVSEMNIKVDFIFMEYFFSSSFFFFWKSLKIYRFFFFILFLISMVFFL